MYIICIYIYIYTHMLHNHICVCVCVFISLFSYLQLSVLSVLIYIIFYVHDDKYPYHTCLSIYRQRWHSSRLNAAKVLQRSSLELSKFRFCLMAAGSLPEQKQVKNSFNRQNRYRIDAVFIRFPFMLFIYVHLHLLSQLPVSFMCGSSVHLSFVAPRMRRPLEVVTFRGGQANGKLKWLVYTGQSH